MRMINIAYRKRSTGRKSYSSRPAKRYRKAPAKRRSTARRGPQTMKIVVEVAPQNPVSRPDIAGLSLVEKPKGKAKL